MRWMIFKVIAFVAIFLFTHAVILPWAISNDVMPLWGNIIAVSFVVVLWLAFIDRIAFQLIRIVGGKDESTE